MTGPPTWDRTAKPYLDTLGMTAVSLTALN